MRAVPSDNSEAAVTAAKMVFEMVSQQAALRVERKVRRLVGMLDQPWADGMAVVWAALSVVEWVESMADQWADMWAGYSAYWKAECWVDGRVEKMVGD